MADKILTVIVPSYNMEKYLPKCLGSLVVAPEQMERLEVLVVNDGSKDRTSEIAHEFETNYPQTFNVIDKENGHYGSCVNAGLKMATGMYVKILDADDYFDGGAFNEYMKVLLSDHQNYDVILTDYAVVNADGKVMGVRAPNIETDDVLDMHAVTYRTEFVKELGYRQTEGIAYTDTEWAMIPFSASKLKKYIPLKVYQYLVGREGQSVSPDVAVRSVRDLERVVRTLIKYRNESRQHIQVEYTHFYDNMLCNKVSMVYTLMLLKCRYKNVAGRLIEFDRFVRDYYKVGYDKAEEFLCPRSLGFSPVRFWRKHRICSQWVLSLIRIYLKIVSK